MIDLFINGKRQKSSNGETRDIIHPADGSIVEIAHTIRNISQKRIQQESALRENELTLSAALKVKRNLPKGATFAAMNVSM